MRKTLWSIIASALVVGFIIGMIVWQKKQDARPFNQFDFPETVEVVNHTDFKADTMSMVLAHEILGLDTLNLVITYIPDHINSDELVFLGMIQQIPFKPNQFVLLLKKRMSFSQLKTVLSHEFVHIGQYIYGDLTVYPEYATYAVDTIVFIEVKYKDRTFEKEAFKQQGRMLKKLNRLLYETD